MILMNFWNPVGFGAVLRRMISGSLSKERLPRGGRELDDSLREPPSRRESPPLREPLRRLRSPPPPLREPLRDPPRERELLLRFRSPPDDEFCMGLNKVSSQSGTPREAELIMAVGRDIFPAGVKSGSPDVAYPSPRELMSKLYPQTEIRREPAGSERDIVVRLLTVTSGGFPERRTVVGVARRSGLA